MAVTKRSRGDWVEPFGNQGGEGATADNKHSCIVCGVDYSFGRASRHHDDLDVEPAYRVLGKHLLQISACLLY